MQATFQLEPHQVQRMIELAAPEYGREKAIQDALAKTYKVNAELEKRLQLTERTIRKKIREGKLRAEPAADKKGYRVTELACREFLGDIKRHHLPRG